MNKTVEITHGLFKGKNGVLSAPFDYCGRTMYVVYITEVDNLTGIRYLAYTTVSENEYTIL